MSWPPKPLGETSLRQIRAAKPGSGASTPHAATHSDGAGDEIVVENLATALGANAILMGDGLGGLTSGSDNCRIFTGTYTGDGATSQVITCPGAGAATTIRYLRIWQRITSSGDPVTIWESTREINDDSTDGMGVQPSYQTVDQAGTGVSWGVTNTIIALGTNGTFTVDDGGSDYHPNRNSSVYNYYALGS